MLLSGFPRVQLAHLPTPLEILPRLSEALGGPEIWVKRDDCTGLATGGNKTRKLEFSMGEAQERGADTIITVGAVQSNHVRQTAAAACKLGMKCEVLLEHRVSDPSELYRNSGNVLLDRIFGARLREYAAGTDFDVAMEEVAGEVRAAGGVPYIVPGGASNPVGALGYVGCGEELLQQCEEQDVHFDHIVTATGSAGTHAGLAVGLRGSGSDLPILGIGVNAPKDAQEDKVYKLAVETAELVEKPGCVAREDIIADCNYIGPGYGQPTKAMNEAVLLLARTEGLLFDPVYSGKALAGMIDYVRRGRFDNAQRIVFLHTGGAAGLFAYADILDLE
ncbi:MAG: D-cysteine desulfhydrase [Gammaproteobacteria bacterium]|jgi:L-cysteate sulfo-lyase|nr:D-cysteine desulfhydrase [Gammaproteobacteria bacterium]MDH3777424.1 D-cysteine desulfhydrase [Gammaproteobacteria bacterium]MDH3810272.1 D-cysteine desulfhydrase [Gammaproteobacteria bacterium]